VLDTGLGPGHDGAVFNQPRGFHAPPRIRHDTKAWKAQVWISFGAAASLCATGLAWLPGQDIDRAFMVMGYLFCLSTAFAVAKYVRDNEAAPRRHAAVGPGGVGRLRRRWR
jgi:hypothetical protein